MEFQKNDHLTFITDEVLLKKAQEITIKKYHHISSPQRFQRQTANTTFSDFTKITNDEALLMQQQEWVTFDFGDHQVGKLTFQLQAVGSPPDAPAKIYFRLAETLGELSRDFSDYHGELSAAWLQEGLLTIDTLPRAVKLDRRYAFRYLQVLVIATSPKYQVTFTCSCETVSSADIQQMKILTIPDDPILVQIDKIAQKTLVQCMQDVFEDGPKRDRRLWLGDLRLQAQANYVTFQENDLVKKCLYLFAAIKAENQQVSANVFIEPRLIPDDTFLADYSLFFIDCLLSYYQATGDQATLADLYPVAAAQVVALADYVQENGQVLLPVGWNIFVDWQPELDKTAAAQGIFLFAYKKMLTLAELINDQQLVEALTEKIFLLENYAMKALYDENIGLFLSGKQQQISIASQAWLILAEVGTADFRQSILQALLKLPPEQVVQANTPYMFHHLAEALLQEGFHQEGLQLIKDYWGGMIAAGADTFWEAYNPEKPDFSPYGDPMIDSYCHAWSCTPCYLLRKYQLAGEEA